jgi:hypothetical protein
VNLAGVEVVLNLRDQIEKIQGETRKLLESYEAKMRAAGIEPEPAQDVANPTGLVKLSPQGLRKR